jgi:hypothetical protein
VSDDLVQSVDKKIVKDGASQFQNFPFKSSQISRTVLHEIIPVRLGYDRKFCARWVPKMLTGAHKTQRMASAFVDFLERCHKDDHENLNHIGRVIGDETWVSFLNVETKEQSKQSMHTHSPNNPKKFKQTLSVRKLMTFVFWDREGVLMVDFMQQGTTVTSELYCETLKNTA